MRKNSTMTNFGWIPGGSSYVTPMSCEGAEHLRERLYKPGAPEGIKDSDLAAAISGADPKADVLAKVARARAALVATPPSQFRIVLDTQLLAIAKNQTIYCFVSERGWAQVLCGVSAISVLVSGYDLWNKLAGSGATQADNAEAIALLDNVKQEVTTRLAAKPAKVPIAVARQRVFDTQVGLCRAIQQSCLH